MDIREIAKRARVSTATVSRTVNGITTVSPTLAKRVWKVVHELGYYPNTQARALVSGRSRILGLIVSEIVNPFFPRFVQVFETIAVQHNYEILLTSTTVQVVNSNFITLECHGRRPQCRHFGVDCPHGLLHCCPCARSVPNPRGVA